MSKSTLRLFKPGARVVLTCEGKAELGITGTVVSIHPYDGPRMYADWMYRLRDVRWGDGDVRGPITVRETWLKLEES